MNRFRAWCTGNGGTVDSSGKCNTTGPNWKCGTATGANTQPGANPVDSMLQAFANTPGNLNARGNAMAMAGTQQLMTNLFASIFSQGNNNALTQQQLEQQREAELQAEAERKAAEELHKQQMLDDLSGQMKLSSPSALMADPANSVGGLALKLSAGIPGLPGIYLNDSPASVGPVSGASSGIEASGLQLKLGDGDSSRAAASPTMIASADTARPSYPGSNAQAPGTSADAQSSQPAVTASGLQLKLGRDSAGQPAANPSATGGSNVGTTLTPAATSLTSTNPASDASTAGSTAGGSPSAAPAAPAGDTALAQLKQIQANSAAAATASSPEAIKEEAAAGWDGGSIHTGSPVSLPTASGTVAIPRQASAAPAATQASSTPPVTASVVNPAPIFASPTPAASAVGAPIPGAQISAVIKAMSDEQLQAQYCRVTAQIVQMKKDFEKEGADFDAFQTGRGVETRKAYEDARDCFFTLLAEKLADLTMGGTTDIGEKIAAELGHAWKNAEEFKKGVREDAEAPIEIVRARQEILEAQEKYNKTIEENQKTLAEHPELKDQVQTLNTRAQKEFAGTILESFYSVATTVDAFGFIGGEKSLKVFGVSGEVFSASDWIALDHCMVDYAYSIAQQRAIDDELNTAINNVEAQMKAEQSMSKFSKDLVDEQVLRGLHPAQACKQ